MRELIRQLSRENPLWGAERIRETLLLLQYDPPSEDTIRKYMIQPRSPKPRSTTWLPFLRNHLDVSWAMGFFTVTTQYGVTLCVHYSGLWDRLAAKRHPDWACMTETGQRHGDYLSVFGPYVEKLLIPQIKELCDE